jgi:WD40 repeat protein
MKMVIETPKLVATSGDRFSCSIEESICRDKARDESQAQESSSPNCTAEGSHETNYFKSMQWYFLSKKPLVSLADGTRSPDGTSLITSSADNTLRLFIAPPDLLSPTPKPHILAPYTTFITPEPTYAQTPYPAFNLSDPNTTLLLTSPRDHPIQLLNLLSPTATPTATYPLISPTSEAFLTPSALTFHPSGSAFYTGTDCLITLFNISRSGSGPTTWLPTIPSKRHKMKGGGVGMRGIVSCLALQPEPGAGMTSMLAAGTWTRWVSLYDAEGMGGTVSNFGVQEAADKEAGIGGAGVSQVVWSTCGRYLLVVERKSRGVLVYDVRVSGRLLGWARGRQAETNQRLGVDVCAADGGTEIWAGGTDGIVRVWKNVESKEGGIDPDMEWAAHSETAVVGTAVHASGCVVATASGTREELNYQDAEKESDSEDSDAEDEASDKDDSLSQNSSGRPSISSLSSKSLALNENKVDNSLKIWNLL